MNYTTLHYTTRYGLRVPGTGWRVPGISHRVARAGCRVQVHVLAGAYQGGMYRVARACRVARAGWRVH